MKSLETKPNVIVVVTAHWQAEVVTVSSGSAHSLYFDYGGFPDEAYKYEYSAAGSPATAEKIQQLLKAAGIDCRLDSERGWDHGVFVPLMVMVPDASIPVV